MNYTQLELERLKDVLQTGMLDTPYEKEFDELTRLASVICATPIAIISLIDDKRQWYKSKIGIDFSEVPINESICQYTIREDQLLEITNTTEHEYSKNSPHVLGQDGMRFYAGVPLKSQRGYNIGTVCVVDMIPKKLSNAQKEALAIIGLQAQRLIQIRSKNTDLGTELERLLEQQVAEKEEEVKRTKEAYNSLYIAMSKSSAMIEFTPQGKILTINQKYLNLSGFEEQDLLDKPHSVLVCDEDQEEARNFWELLQKGETKSGRMKRKRHDGSTFWVQASYNPILNSLGMVEKVIKVAQNITPEVEADLAMQKAKNMAEMLNSQKDSFIANMSHEIRTPINAILGFSELLYESEDRPEKKEYLESVLIAGNKLLLLVNDILDLSKIEAGVIRMDKSAYSVSELIKNVFNLFKLEVRKKGLEYTYSIDERIPQTVLGDKNRISQVLTNLLSNALKFTPKGAVKLEVLYENGGLLFSVTDTGIGIPVNSYDKIFGRFSQAEESTFRRFGGTGLGLNISKSLVEKMGGELSFKSEVGKGTQFFFSLPLVMAELDSANIIQKIEVSELNCKILLLEDNELNQRLILSIFMDSEVEIDVAENGMVGLELIEKNQYDLILMDVQMPLMDGYQTSRIIREKYNQEIPIIALTAHSMLAEKDKCLEAGMNDYLSKPFEKQALLQKIQYWMKQANPIPLQNNNPSHLNPKRKILSLDYLKEMAGNDLDFINEMVNMFKSQLNILPEEINQLLLNNQHQELQLKLHKLKSSFGMFQIQNNLLSQLENDLNSPENHTLIDQKIKDLYKLIQHILEELEN